MTSVTELMLGCDCHDHMENRRYARVGLLDNTS